MDAGSARRFNASVNFGQKQKDQYFVFVPGEELHGFVSVKLASPMNFKACHLEFRGHFKVQNGYNPTKPKPDTMLEKDVSCAKFTYSAKQGDDKVRSFTFNFSLAFPADAAPSFEWKGDKSKPDALTCASLNYEMFLWIEMPGGPSEAPKHPDPLRSPPVAIAVISPEISNTLGGPKSAQAIPRRETRARAGGEKQGVEVELSVHEAVLVVSAEPSHPTTISCVSDVKVLGKKKPCDALLYLVDEIVTIRIGAAKPVEFRTNILRSKTENWYCDALKSNRNKHAMEVSRPRGNDNIGALRHQSVDLDCFSIAHVVSALPCMKGLKEGDVKASVPLVFGLAPAALATRHFEVTLC